jgi:hypothetical protein
MTSALSSLGICTIGLLWMVTKWKMINHQCLANAVQEESLRPHVFRVLQVEHGQFHKILEQGELRMNEMSVYPQYQTAGMATLWPLLYI